MDVLSVSCERALIRFRTLAFESLEGRHMLAADLSLAGLGIGVKELNYFIGSAPSSPSQAVYQGVLESGIAAWSAENHIKLTRTEVLGQKNTLDFTSGALGAIVENIKQTYFPNGLDSKVNLSDIPFDSSGKVQLGKLGKLLGNDKLDIVSIASQKILQTLGLNKSPQVDSPTASTGTAAQLVNGSKMPTTEESPPVLAEVSKPVLKTAPNTEPKTVVTPGSNPIANHASKVVSSQASKVVSSQASKVVSSQASNTASPSIANNVVKVASSFTSSPFFNKALTVVTNRALDSVSRSITQHATHSDTSTVYTSSVVITNPTAANSTPIQGPSFFSNLDLTWNLSTNLKSSRTPWNGQNRDTTSAHFVGNLVVAGNSPASRIPLDRMSSAVDTSSDPNQRDSLALGRDLPSPLAIDRALTQLFA